MDPLEQNLKILGLQPGASPDEARKAFRDLVKLWHPDRFERLPELKELAEERLKEINDAYDKIRSSQAHAASRQKPRAKKKKPPRKEKKDRPPVEKKGSLETLIKEWAPAARAMVGKANRAVHAAADFTRKMTSALPTDFFKKHVKNKNASTSPGPDGPRTEDGLKEADDVVEKSFKEVFEEVAKRRLRR